MKAIIFGGSSGIGKAVAKRCAQECNDLLICSRNEDKLSKTVEEIRTLNTCRVSYKIVDLSDTDNLSFLLDEIVESFGIPDYVLLNGGGPPFGTFESIELETWYQYFNQIIISNIQILKKFLPLMRSKGSVVFILSDVIRNAGAGKVLPCSLRMALMGIFKCLSFEYAERSIRLNAVSPGPTQTERAVNLLNSSAEKQNISFEEMKIKFCSNLPMKRMASPEEVAEIVHFLFSEKSSYITGCNIMCDGGLTVAPF